MRRLLLSGTKTLRKNYFSIVDVIKVLTETKRPLKYWADLKSKLFKEGSQLSANMGQLKMHL